MRNRAKEWWGWASSRPRVLINLIGLVILIVGAAGIFAWLITKPIDVIEDWTMRTTEVVYHPGDTLEFISKSTKLISADGTSSRIFDCDAVGGQSAREIQLDSIVANKAPGYNPPRENSILVPDVAKFNGLPRTCRLVINTCYNDVILWRDHCESAKTNDFQVIKQDFNADSIRQQIQDLQNQIEELKRQLAVTESKSSSVATVTPQKSTVNNQTSSQPQNNPKPVAPANPDPPSDKGILLPLIEGVVNLIF